MFVWIGKDFFRTDRLGKSVNKSHIVLIPKHHDAFDITDFRPVAFWNGVYKSSLASWYEAYTDDHQKGARGVHPLSAYSGPYYLCL